MGTVGNDMLIVLSALQIVSGLCEPIMEKVETNLGCMGISWFCHHWKRLQAMNSKMWINHQVLPLLQQSNAISLMKAFSKIAGTKIRRLEMANCCRIYLRIITIADLANERGGQIPGNKMDGKWRVSIVYPRVVNATMPNTKILGSIPMVHQKSVCPTTTPRQTQQAGSPQ